MLFEDWIEKQLLKPFPESVIAINFNLYETDDENLFDAQIVGCEHYDANDDDWACNTVFSSGEDLFQFRSDDWESALSDFKNILCNYLHTHPKTKLNKFEHISFGFVDGDLIPIKPEEF